jgi:hypothetical protein
MKTLADSDFYNGGYEEAERLLRQKLLLREESRGPDDASLVATLTQLADLCLLQGKYQVAERLIRRALRLAEKADGPNISR